MWRNVCLLIILGSMAGCALPWSPQERPGYVLSEAWRSPSHGSRVRQLVIHYTDSPLVPSLLTLTGPRVSAHYVLPVPSRQPGARPLVYRLVDESRRAWHAGASAWRGRPGLNDTSIGIEVVNAGPDGDVAEVERQLSADPDAEIDLDWAPYPEAQVEALIVLARDIITRHDIRPTEVVGHADIAPTRKIDPGPAFPWRRLYDAGIGTWPEDDRVAHWHDSFEREPPGLARLQAALAAWGHPLEASGEFDATTRAVLRAFQMRYRPGDYRGRPDAETAAILWALLERYRPDALKSL
jgi:N-acetylmuramoyl-L-alanine amidase